MNWIDRKSAREQNLKQDPEVWNGATSAIHDAISTFNEKYGKARVVPQNGYRILIEVEQQHEFAHIYGADSTRRVVIILDQAKLAITTKLDAEPARTFQIEADETHCFLKYAGKEINYDEFSKLALEDACFKAKKNPPRRIQSHAARGSAFS